LKCLTAEFVKAVSQNPKGIARLQKRGPPMKALSIQQPWAWAILFAGKDIENRTWNTHYRGEIVIHAPASFQSFARWPRSVPRPDPEALHLRAILGVADLVDVVERSRSRWWLGGPFGFVLANPRPLAETIPCKGNSSFWSVPAAVARSIRRQLDMAETPIRHFIAYHNTKKMGRPLQESEPLRLLTNKPVNRLMHNMVWFVSGTGSGTRQYALGSVFRVGEVGEAARDGFERFAAGPGHVFQPPIQIKDLKWFPNLLRATGRFGFGVQEVKDEAVIAGLTQLAAQAGYSIEQV
jgi:hypothetical protein